MNVSFTNDFLKQLQALRDRKLADAVARVIDEVEAASSIREVRNVKKLKGHRSAYRIRVGDFRIGLFVLEDSVLFAAVLPRRDVYRKFP